MKNKIKSMGLLFGIIILTIACLFGGLYLGINKSKTYAGSDYTTFWSDNTTPWLGESSDSPDFGTIDSPFEIDSAQKLAHLAKNVNEGKSYLGKVFRLSGEIDLSGHNWIPIGTKAHPFRGTLYGYGSSILNLTIDANKMQGLDTIEYLGLFGYVENGDSKDNQVIVNQLKFVNANIFANENTKYAGTIAGYFNGAKLENIHISDTEQDRAFISYFLDKGAMQVNDFVAGGLVGFLGPQAEIKVVDGGKTNQMNTFLSTNIQKLNGKRLVLGGLVGKNCGVVRQSYRTSGDINAYVGTIGGLVGENFDNGEHKGLIEDCYNIANITLKCDLPETEILDTKVNGTEETFIGGLVGINYTDVNLKYFSNIFTTLTSQNSANIFQTCYGNIGGICGFNKGIIKDLVNSAFIKCAGKNVQYAGGISAINAGTIENCVNKGIIGAEINANYPVEVAGGIVGLNDSIIEGDGGLGKGDGYLVGVKNFANIGENLYIEKAGGIVGINATGNISQPANIFGKAEYGAVKNSGTIRGNYSGGIVGRNFGKVWGAYNEGDVLCMNEDIFAQNIVGGVAGTSTKGSFENCFNIGKVGSGNDVGGFVGILQSSTNDFTSIKNCANYGDVTGRGSIGGFVGYMEEGKLDFVISVGDVDCEKGYSSEDIGGVIGGIKPNELNPAAPNPEVELLNMAYSSSVANYYKSDKTIADNRLAAIGGDFSALHTEAKLESQNMTLPGIENDKLNNFYKFYKNDLEGRETLNKNWYFAPVNEIANKYYYPILNIFKSGEVDNLNVYSNLPSKPCPEGGLDYPSDVIFKVTFNNNLPKWDSTQGKKVIEVENICADKFVIKGQYIQEPEISTEPKGFKKQWKNNGSDLDFKNPIYVNENMELVLNWVEKTFKIKYYLKNGIEGTFDFSTPISEIKQCGLKESFTYSLDPNAREDFVLINLNNGYSYRVWWICDKMDEVGLDMDTANLQSGYSKNVDYQEGALYAYGIKTAREYTVTLNPGVNNSGEKMSFVGLEPGETMTISLTYGQDYIINPVEYPLNYDPVNISFKGWFYKKELPSGLTELVACTDTDGVGLEPFTIIHSGIVFVAQWTNSEQTVKFFSFDSERIKYDLKTIKVTYNDTIKDTNFGLKYFEPNEQAGYEVDQYFADENCSIVFDFENTKIVEQTSIYVTWKKALFNLILNADGGYFNVEGSPNEILIFRDIEYKSNFLNNVLNKLNTAQRPYKEGFTPVLNIENNKMVWNTQQNSQGVIISESNNNNLMPAQNLVVYIMWEFAKYNVNLIANGGIFGDSSIVHTVQLDYQANLKSYLINDIAEEDLPTAVGYKFRYWSFEQSGEDGELAPQIHDKFTMPAQDINVYAVWGKEFIVTFCKKFLNDQGEGNVYKVSVFEGDTLNEPNLIEIGFEISGMDFVEWKRFVGKETTPDGDVEKYETCEWPMLITQDTVFVGAWQENGEVIKVKDNKKAIIIASVIIVVIVVIMFVVILVRTRKKIFPLDNKRYRTKANAQTIDKLKEMEQRRKDENPFD